ncbi:unnamed protein product [Blepharisma stoltei]|uniref:Uncharacterized protein n=1 Tax=Blepharisma stoltei TaxID=1481888 RepID=A0AAU9KR52_9CILI|nr:unnamed protein product [Blepharisma stoltei]
MGIEYSCLKNDLRLNNDEIFIQENKELATAQELTHESHDSEIIIGAQTTGQKNKRYYIEIQSAARGYLVRREWSAIKKINQDKNEESKEPSEHKSKEKKHDKSTSKYSANTLQTSTYSYFTQENGATYEGDLNEKGEKHGEGIEIYPNGCKYVGFYKNNLRAELEAMFSQMGMFIKESLTKDSPMEKEFFMLMGE